ncbi:MAG: hypothetical protein IPL35_15275 [Sphingobacteriales bacterium]|nr:hypothetical protein [Sphingobacteriales bacterium]
MAFWTHSFTEFPGSPYSLGNRKNEGILVESRGDTEEASLRFRYDIAGDNAYVSSGLINDGNWHHIAFYQKGGKVGDEYGIYVDGKKVDTKKVPREKNSRVEFIILNFIGETDDTRIYNFALDDAQVAALYNKGTLTTEVFLEANGKKFGPLHHYLKK